MKEKFCTWFRSCNRHSYLTLL